MLTLLAQRAALHFYTSLACHSFKMSYKRKMPSSEDRFQKRAKVDQSTSRPFRSRTVPKQPAANFRTSSVPCKPPLRAVLELPLQRAPLSHLAQRAIKRQEFDAEQKQKNDEISCMKREDDFSHALREETAIKALRKNLVFHANPIHKYSSVCLQRSERKLTEPRSPALQTARRAELYYLAL